MQYKADDKSTKILELTRNKTRQLSFLLNNELIELFKTVCRKNNIKQVQLIETWIIYYLEENKMI